MTTTDWVSGYVAYIKYMDYDFNEFWSYYYSDTINASPSGNCTYVTISGNYVYAGFSITSIMSNY